MLEPSSPSVQSFLIYLMTYDTHLHFSHRYQTLTLPEEGSSACMFVNGTLVHRTKEETPKCDAVSKIMNTPPLSFMTSPNNKKNKETKKVNPFS